MVRLSFVLSASGGPSLKCPSHGLFALGLLAGGAAIPLFLHGTTESVGLLLLAATLSFVDLMRTDDSGGSGHPVHGTTPVL
ncbi:MAG: hypothetical protein ACE37K_18195 [Planctomycetota bacterium]